MKLYFVRHAPTYSNRTGIMVKDYDASDIDIYDKPEDWEEKVGKFIPNEAREYIVTAPAKRCIHTAQLLFERTPNEVVKCLSEFDCKALGDSKFWELTKKEFDSLVFLPSSTMEKRALEIVTDMCNMIKHESKNDSAVCISHGMLIRYLYHFLTGNADISAYDVINSKGFVFSNLDLMIYDTETKTVEVHHYNDPINHKAYA